MSLNEVQVIRESRITAVLIPPSWLGLELDLSGLDGSNPEKAIDIINRIHPVALLDGPMFSVPGGEGYGTYGLANLKYRYLDRGRGIDVPSEFPSRGGTVSVVNGQAFYKNGDAIENGATLAIQGYPSIVENGRNVASTRNDTNTTGRSAVGIFRDGRIAFAVGTFSMREFANRLIQIGILNAAYTDGGSSTALFGPGVSIGLRARRLPAYLIAVPPSNTVNPPTPVPVAPEEAQDLGSGDLEDSSPQQHEESQPSYYSESEAKGNYIEVVKDVLREEPEKVIIPSIILFAGLGAVGYAIYLKYKK